MSLLLDARKKSQQANSMQAADDNHSGHGLSLEPLASQADKTPASAPPSGNSARAVGQNLFNAKSASASPARPGISRNLLIALGGTVVLLSAGAGYVWHEISPNSPQPMRPINRPVIASPQQPAVAQATPQNNLVPGIASTEAVPPKPAKTTKRTHVHVKHTKPVSPPAQNDSLHIEQHQDEPIDPLLNDAYLAYRSGRFEQAQQLYHKVLDLDANNMDALLGLAAIAQRNGTDNVAAHYYAQVLALDPRNAVANAGMAALTNDDNRESRLKMLIDEQPDSPSLHFALGNYYAQQARWGEAQQAYLDAYKLQPDNAELAFNLAVSLDRLGQKKAAAQYYQRALQLDPGHHAGFDYTKISQHIEELTH